MHSGAPFDKLKKSFRSRIFAILSLLIIAVSTTFTAAHIIDENSIKFDRLITDGKLLAWSLAYNSRLAVYSEHQGMLSEAAEAILQHKDVISATIYSIDGRLLINRTRQPRATLPDARTSFADALGKAGPLLKNPKDTLYVDREGWVEFYALIVSSPGYSSSESLYFSDKPIDEPERTIGLVRVILDKKALNASRIRLIWVGILAGALFMVTGSALIYLTMRGLTRPLKRLLEGVRSLERGDLSTQIPVVTEDELGVVSRAFNVMAQTLEQRELEKRELGEQLRLAQKREAKEEWERTFDSVPDMIAILDTDYRIIRANNALANRLQVTKEDAVGTRMYEQFHGASSTGITPVLTSLVDDSMKFSGEIYQEKQQNFFLVSITPLVRNDGSIAGSVYVSRDITNRKLAEDLLRKSEERFRLIADTIEEAIWMADIDLNTILYVSPRFELIWGRTGESFCRAPRSFMEAIHPDDRDRVSSDYELKKSSQPFDHEFRILRPDGSVRWIRNQGYPVRGEAGINTCYIEVARDITEQKHAEEEKQAIQAKLVQTNKMTSLGLMVSGLAHEVNNPNNVIKLAAHLLDKTWKDIVPILEKRYREEGDFRIAGQKYTLAKTIVPEHITGIRNNALRIEGIIRNLRDFARKGVANLHSRADLNTIVSMAATILNSQIKNFCRNFNLVLDEKVPTVRGNPQQLEQVVINLILNAIQSLPTRERKVTVATSFDQINGFAVIRVDDEGAGIPPDVKERIGEPFFTTKIDRGGTGLGLAISAFIIKEHRGLLEFDSEPGNGTTVRVKLPVALDE